MLAILAPGQGAQSPVFLQPWLHLPPYADRLGDLLSAVPGLPAELDAASVLEDTALRVSPERLAPLLSSAVVDGRLAATIPRHGVQLIRLWPTRQP